MSEDKKNKKKKVKKEKVNTRNKIKSTEAKIKDKASIRLDEVNEEMRELLDKIKEETGAEDVKIVEVKVPKYNAKQFFTDLLLSFFINLLLMFGLAGYIHFVDFDSLLNLLLFTTFFTLYDRVLFFFFAKFNSIMILRSLGLAYLIPEIGLLAILYFFPIGISIPNPLTFFICLIVVGLLRTFLVNYIKQKIYLSKLLKLNNNKKETNHDK